MALRFDLPVSDPGKCKESRPIFDDVVHKRLQMETHAFCRKSIDGKYASYLDPDETVELVIRAPQVPFQMCNVMSAKACNELQDHVRFVPRKCILSVMLGGLIMVVGGSVFFATVFLPTKYGLAFYEAYVGDQAFSSFLTSMHNSSITTAVGWMEAFFAGAVFQAVAAPSVLRKLAEQQAECIEIAEDAINVRRRENAVRECWNLLSVVERIGIYEQTVFVDLATTTRNPTAEQMDH